MSSILHAKVSEVTRSLQMVLWQRTDDKFFCHNGNSYLKTYQNKAQGVRKD